MLTEPIPDRLAELGWTGGELLSDSRFTISYFRTTADGRIAFGGGVAARASAVASVIRSRTTVARSHAWSLTSTTCCRCSATRA